MTKEEMAMEYGKAKEEHDRLTKRLKCLKLRSIRYERALSNVIPYLKDLQDEDRESNATLTDSEDFPTQEQIRNVCKDVFDTEYELRKIKKFL